MNEIAIINTFLSLVMLLAIFVFVIRWYPAIRIEEFRQNVFEIRDSLFDQAADGKVRFQDDAYRVLRTICNGLLRDAEELTFGHFVSLAFEKQVMAGKGFTRNDPFTAALAAVDPARKAIYKNHSDKLVMAYITLIARRNIALYVMISVALSFESAAKGLGRLFRLRESPGPGNRSPIIGMGKRVEHQLRQREFEVGEATQMACAA